MIGCCVGRARFRRLASEEIDGPGWFNLQAGAASFGVEAPLRRRSQFALQPALCFSGFHGVSQIGDNLMNVAALWALKGVDMEAPTAGRGPRQHRCCCCFADWTQRSDMEGHVCAP